MSKNIKTDLMLQLPAGKALPKPPVSTVIGTTGISLKKFCDDFNEWSKDMEGNVNVGIIIYDDLSYSFMNELEYSEYVDKEFYRACEEAYMYRHLCDIIAHNILGEESDKNKDNIVKFHL